MKTFPGLEQMRVHIPDMRTRRGSLLVGLYVLTGLVLTTIAMYGMYWPLDRLPQRAQNLPSVSDNHL